MLLRTAPTWIGIALVWIGLAALFEGLAVIAVFVAIIVFLGTAVSVTRRRRANEGDERTRDAEALQRIARHSRLASVGSISLAAAALIYCGTSSAGILIASGFALLALGGFETRRLLASSAASASRVD
jgi:hypothetical protein